MSPFSLRGAARKGNIRILVNGGAGHHGECFLPTASHFASGGGRGPMTPIRIRVAIDASRGCVTLFHVRACDSN
jgi:hypothetical protein